ncbi:hypothetical protein [Lederbergia lenta]|uniref:hypothetical protein n=1 Tax=Lederbergia lenta TaxID=1467 RepID=UPI00203D4D61|nr:hypothetical protein [Lederbergia lenta]MCM3109857.1 hypothetical protein [Lederbergia lenta]
MEKLSDHYGIRHVLPPVFMCAIPILNIVYLTKELLTGGRDILDESLKIENELHRCRNKECNRYFREYQYRLIQLKSDLYEPCPHCESSHHTNYSSIEESNWMKTHPDCPRIGAFQILKLQKDIVKISNLTNNINDIEEYMQYQRETDRL